jgi:hypothetical protein
VHANITFWCEDNNQMQAPLINSIDQKIQEIQALHLVFAQTRLAEEGAIVSGKVDQLESDDNVC